MSVQEEDEIGLKRVFGRQLHIKRAHKHTPKTSKLNISSQSDINFTDDILMLWSRRRSHHKHSIHNFITPPISGKSGIVLIRPGALWRPRNPISRNDHREFFLCCYHITPPLYEKDTISPGKRGKLLPHLR